MNDTRTTRQRIEREIERKQHEIQRLEDLLVTFPALGDLTVDVSFCGSYLDFDHLSHEDVIKVIKAVGGKWNKEPCDGKINYSTTIEGMRLRCWQGEPPPSCRIVEEEVVIPAQPERREMRRKLVCIEPKEETLHDEVLDGKDYCGAVSDCTCGKLGCPSRQPSTPEAA